jgi:hypothetical protein
MQSAKEQIQQKIEEVHKQLLQAQKERNHAQDLLKQLRQKRNHAQDLLKQLRQKHNHAQEQLGQAQKNSRKQTWESLCDHLQSFMHTTGQESQRHERGQSSRQEQLRQVEENNSKQTWESFCDRLQSFMHTAAQELRVHDASLPTVQRMQRQLERVQISQDKLWIRLQKMREQIYAVIWMKEDLPRNERLDKLLQQRIGDVLYDHRLIEERYLNQQHWKLLKKKLLDMHKNVRLDYAYLGKHFDDDKMQISVAFINQFEEQIRNRDQTEWEITEAMEAAQKVARGYRPERGNSR